MAIHVIQSQRIEVLVEAMLTTVNQPTQTPFHVLQTQHYIVPSHAVEAWLTQKLAEKKGISANTQFHHRIRGFQKNAPLRIFCTGSDGDWTNKKDSGQKKSRSFPENAGV